jgi:hypothetical protein
MLLITKEATTTEAQALITRLTVTTATTATDFKTAAWTNAYIDLNHFIPPFSWRNC